MPVFERRRELSRIAKRCSLVLVSALCSAGAARAEAPIQPGLWESTETYSMLLSGGSHDRKCLTTQQIQAFLAAPSTKHYRCSYPRQNIEGGRARFDDGACYSKSGRKVLSNVDITGDYGPDRFRLDFRFHYLLNPKLGIPGTATIEAHRISDTCPADLEPGK